jgi:hypothetical protein
MAKNRGWWTLTLEGNLHNDLSDCDREHIARCIKEGYTSGEICTDDC